jgi:hypothetical protein
MDLRRDGRIATREGGSGPGRPDPFKPGSIRVNRSDPAQAGPGPAGGRTARSARARVEGEAVEPGLQPPVQGLRGGRRRIPGSLARGARERLARGGWRGCGEVAGEVTAKRRRRDLHALDSGDHSPHCGDAGELHLCIGARQPSGCGL